MQRSSNVTSTAHPAAPMVSAETLRRHRERVSWQAADDRCCSGAILRRPKKRQLRGSERTLCWRRSCLDCRYHSLGFAAARSS